MSKLTNVYDLFGVDQEDINKEDAENGVQEIDTINLLPFKNHPFKLYEGERLNDMVESIKEHGVITPLIVRPTGNNYEILSGHNRANAAGLAGLNKVPVVIKENLTDEEAMLIVTETNLIQRSFSELSHSEKARILAERYNAIKQQGKRFDLINEIENLCNPDSLEESSSFRPLGEKIRADEKMADKYDLSPRVVSRYLRIDTLVDGLKERIDNCDIPFTAGVDLSFLKENEQDIIVDILNTYGFKIDLKKSDLLKSFSQGKTFNYEKSYNVLSGEYFDKPKKAKNIKFTSKFTKNINKYFKENQSQREIEDTIEKALDFYFQQEQSFEEDMEEEL